MQQSITEPSVGGSCDDVCNETISDSIDPRVKECAKTTAVKK